ncbi:MAG: hypothetical protein AB1765_01860, partial [Candidatus Hydrogenedentota bacterium]
MKKIFYIFIFLLILLFILPSDSCYAILQQQIIHAKSVNTLNRKPASKVKLEYETGKRYIPEDSDYTEEDANIESSYSYDISKFNFTRNLSKEWYLSLTAKRITRRYALFTDLDLNSESEHLFGFLRYRKSKNFWFKVDWNYRKKDYDDPLSLSDNKWLALGTEMKYETVKDIYSLSYTNKFNEFYIAPS